MKEPVPFCERHVRGWIALLAIVAIVVLAVSVGMAATGEGNLGLSRMHRMFGWAPNGPSEPSLPRMPPGPAFAPGPQPGPAFAPGPQPGAPAAVVPPAVQPTPVPPVAVGGWPQPGTPVAPAPGTTNNVDLVVRATPGGGIRFVGGAASPTSPNFNTTFSRAASAIRPSVVSISASRPQSPYNPPPVQALPGPQFLDPYDGVPDSMVAGQPFEAVGSGVIVDPAGYVVTNYHVISGASGIVASLGTQPETHLPAQAVITDPESDLALLKIDAGVGNYPAAILGDSSRMQVGDWVLAVGYPFGLELTVTAGIVSGTRVALDIGRQPFRGLLQTDAPINKGSSGGPLVDINGQVVGINTAIYAPTGVFSGTGFAIPSNRVGAFVARGLEAMGVASPARQSPPSRPLGPQTGLRAGAVWLGLGLVDMNPEMASQLSYPFPGGAFVASVILDSPAEEAEVLRGDVIVSIADQQITDVSTVGQVVSRLAPGQAVPVTIWRSGKTSVVTMRLRGGG